MTSASPRTSRRAPTRLDAPAMLLCAIVGLDTFGAVAANGPQGLTWMVVLGLLFFAPYGLLIAELGAAFPHEGGPYTWTKLAFGRLPAGINQVFYWISNPVWLGGSLCIVALTTFETFFHPLPGAWQYLAGAIFVGAAGYAVHASETVGRRVTLAGALARILLLGFFVLSLAVYAVRHGVQSQPGGDYLPTYLGLVALTPVIAFNYMGFEIPSAAEAIGNPRREVPAALLRGGLGSALLYGVPILGTLLVLPAERLGSLSGFIDACRAVFTVYGGHVTADGDIVLTGAGAVLAKVAAAGLIIGLFTSGTAWAMGLSRAQAVACADGAGPAWLGRVSARTGAPVRVNLLSTAIAATVMVASIALTDGDARKYFSAGIGLAISATAISYLLTFSSFLVLRRKYPDTHRPYRVPGGAAGAWTVTVLTVGTMLFTVVALVWPGLGVGWFGTSGTPADYLPDGFAGQRGAYTASQLVPIALILAIGLLFHLLGRRARPSTTPDRGVTVDAA
ncbi:APC family permease [Embleya sp. NPDC056575]|uniref:APC family permease n=1 Tax=unclassified Embleya TaxID=2699296 RepID=UPI0036C2E36F